MTRYDEQTGETIFEWPLPAHGPVYLVGDFNAWQTGQTPMRWQERKWVSRFRLAPGRYRYGFRISGAILRDTQAQAEDLSCGWPWSVTVAGGPEFAATHRDASRYGMEIPSSR